MSARRVSARHRATATGSVRRSSTTSSGVGTSRAPAGGAADAVHERPCRAGRRGRPSDEQSVGLVAGVDGVRHRSVERRQVLAHACAEHREVEPGVAAHERIERPHDPVEPVRRGPVALMELQRPSGAGSPGVGDERGDVTVECRRAVVAGEDAEGRADGGRARPLVVAGEADVTAGVRHGGQQLDRHDGRCRTPHRVEHADDLDHLVGRGRRRDGDRGAGHATGAGAVGCSARRWR